MTWVLNALMFWGSKLDNGYGF